MTALNVNIQAYIIPTNDQHMSEYISPRDARRAYISGFTGSAGTAIVSLKQAALFTDGRYFLQATQELDQNWTLMKSGLPGVPSQQEWLCGVLEKKGSRVGVDPLLISALTFSSISSHLASNGHELVAINENLVDAVWNVDGRPDEVLGEIFQLPLKYTGQSVHEKILSIQDEIKKSDRAALVLTALDDVAWTFNLRGSDIDYNPVFFAYAIITQETVVLYTKTSRFAVSERSHLPSVVEIKEYEDFFPDLHQLAARVQGRFWIGPSANHAVASLFPGDKGDFSLTPSTTRKAVKNAVELQGMRDCHVRDAAALCDFMDWIEFQFDQCSAFDLNETAAADKLEEFRSMQPDFLSLSFTTIMGSGPNGAIIHYHPDSKISASITKQKVLLIDSGAQFKDGTTDVTRTIHLGQPTLHEAQCFTRVLKGHIQLALSVFPEGTPGRLLDTFARMPLWKAGLDYRHGTGHGVGCCLNVHEGPFGIGQRPAHMQHPLQVGNIVTNEPGYYEDGAFGIRIENVMEVAVADTPFHFGDVRYLGFKPLTLFPIQHKMIDRSMLTEEEIQWVNDYHATCRQVVGAYLTSIDNNRAYGWLLRNTQPF